MSPPGPELASGGADPAGAVLPVAQVVHAAAGRIRLRVAAMRGDAAFFSRLAAAIEGAGVGNVHANAVTGSILIEGCTTSVEELNALARERGWLQVADAPESAAAILEPALRQWQQTALPRLTRVLPAVVLALAAVQAGRGRLLPPAMSLLLYALDASSERGAALPRDASISA